MTGNENIKIGDKLICNSNTGYMSIGDSVFVWGITETSINDSGSTTGWLSRKDFRWRNFIHKPCESIPEQILQFQEKVKLIQESNIVALEKRRVQIKNRQPYEQ